VFLKHREKEEKKNGTVSFLIRQSIHARIINSIGHLNKARRTFALRQKEQQYNKISEKRTSGRV
jgi:hypothetical protein